MATRLNSIVQMMAVSVARIPTPHNSTIPNNDEHAVAWIAEHTAYCAKSLEMNDDELWKFYDRASSFTRDKYSLPPRENLTGTNATGAHFISGLRANDLRCALLWRAVYKPFWNDKAASSGVTMWS
jgi:hypothetical protein